MKKFFILSFQLFAFSNLIAQSTVATLPFYDGFEYTIDEKLTPSGTPADTTVPGQGLWVYGADVSSSDPIVVAQPWANSKGLPECKGNAIQYKSGTDDPVILFTPQGEESGIIYASYLFRVNSWKTCSETAFYQTWIYNGVQEYMFSFAKTEGSWPGVTNVYASNVYIKRDAKGDSFTVGIAESNAPSKAVYYPKSFQLGENILIVISYKYTSEEGTSYMWVNPTVSSVEPLSTVNTLNDEYANKKTESTSIRGSLDKVRINKNSNSKTADITLDEVRIANTWHEVVGKPAPSVLSKTELSRLKAYPSTIVKDRLTISTSAASLKKVEIMDFSGAQFFSAETKAKAVSTPTLASGTYVLRITESNKTTDYKLIVK